MTFNTVHPDPDLACKTGAVYHLHVLAAGKIAQLAANAWPASVRFGSLADAFLSGATALSWDHYTLTNIGTSGAPLFAPSVVRGSQ